MIMLSVSLVRAVPEDCMRCCYIREINRHFSRLTLLLLRCIRDDSLFERDRHEWFSSILKDHQNWSSEVSSQGYAELTRRW
jgi:hypothetical protein